MKLDKRQTLDLIKVLTHYEILTAHHDDYSTPKVVEDVTNLREQLEDSLVDEEAADDDYETVDEADIEDVEDEDEEDEDDLGEEEEDSDEEDEEDDESEDDGEEDEDSEDDEESEDPEADDTVSADDLHDLTAVRVTDEDDKDLTIEFESRADGEADLIEQNGDAHERVRFVKRFAKELHVGHGDDLEWKVYTVKKFPKGWAQVLPVGELCEVV